MIYECQRFIICNICIILLIFSLNLTFIHGKILAFIWFQFKRLNVLISFQYIRNALHENFRFVPILMHTCRWTAQIPRKSQLNIPNSTSRPCEDFPQNLRPETLMFSACSKCEFCFQFDFKCLVLRGTENILIILIFVQHVVALSLQTRYSKPREVMLRQFQCNSRVNYCLMKDVLRWEDTPRTIFPR